MLQETIIYSYRVLFIGFQSYHFDLNISLRIEIKLCNFSNFYYWLFSILKEYYISGK